MEKENRFAKYKVYRPAVMALAILISGIILDHAEAAFFNQYLQLILFGMAYLIIGGPVVWKAIAKITERDIFNEFSLMSIATIGAFLIGEYAEAVAVMLFYTVGELFQDAAVNRSKRSIEALLKLQVEEVTVIEDEQPSIKHPQEVAPGEIIRVKAGEKVALDGVLISEYASFNTAALTGESVPEDRQQGATVLAGMVNLNKPVEIEVTTKYEDTKLSKILKLVQDAVGRKAKTQQFITRFARVYTPIVVILAVTLTFLPFFFVDTYIFQEWLYRALIFLVISCPCALVISIPLGYFGGIGAASKNGILFKGSNYLELMTKVDTVVMDKTGTLTKGVFEVQEVVSTILDKDDLVNIVAALESHSSHPIAEAIVSYAGEGYQGIDITNVEELSGHGLKGVFNQGEILAGNEKLLHKFNIPISKEAQKISDTIVLIAVDGRFAGYITIADTIKDDAKAAIQLLHQVKINEVIMLSGDKQVVVDKIANTLGLDKAIGGLLPEEKVKIVEELQIAGRLVAFVGDGINDAPVITIADVGLAMGGLGSDAAIETADVVIQTDQPSKIATAIAIGKFTNRIVWQNIALAFGVKLVVLALGAAGMATMWEAVIADVGVALLAIFNAIRIQRMNF